MEWRLCGPRDLKRFIRGPAMRDGAEARRPHTGRYEPVRRPVIQDAFSTRGPRAILGAWRVWSASVVFHGQFLWLGKCNAGVRRGHRVE